MGAGIAQGADFEVAHSLLAMDFGGGSGFGGGSSGGQNMDSENLQNSLNAMVLQLLQNQIRKTCFTRCFKSSFPESMEKNDQICLAKCMDRMYEAHSIVVKASFEMAQNLNS